MGPSGLHKIQDALGGRQVGSGRITMAIKELTRQLNYVRPMTLDSPVPALNDADFSIRQVACVGSRRCGSAILVLSSQIIRVGGLYCRKYEWNFE